MESVRRNQFLLAALAAGASLSVFGCESDSTVARPPGRATAAPRRAPQALDRVAVMGASVSAGFGTGTRLATLLEASMVRSHEPVASDTSWFFFLSPATYATGQMDSTLTADPTLVVAVDYLFWFGYGAIGMDGNPLASEEARLELLDQGLKLCERVRCTLVLGDFPNMEPAVGGMLSRSQMPEPATLVKLNQRLHEWARGRDNVIVIPIDQFINEMRAGKPITIGAHEFAAAATTRWLQDDMLHPTDEGLLAVALLIEDELQKKRLATRQDFAVDPDRVLKRLRTPAAGGTEPATGAGSP